MRKRRQEKKPDEGAISKALELLERARSPQQRVKLLLDFESQYNEKTFRTIQSFWQIELVLKQAKLSKEEIQRIWNPTKP